ncbi:hypothetical protein [Acaryochloris marina]|uniref:Uncharacterized protein n=1 Tax=Acaryochloris marina (strain MBIC 11017) TaxID=329726 RepID=A8ZLE5_ACAM1|nr:hypothetical protein [Acaryochloris marina]ABW31972.1 hypothetical protein AM1_B0253 [Acaryochloris marina MBIC11017]
MNLDRLFGSLNVANTIINGDFSGFELASYSDTPSKNSVGALNESLFSNQAKNMGFLIQEWPEKTRVVMYNFSASNLLAEVEFNNDNPMLEMLLRRLCNPSYEIPLNDFEAMKSQILQGIYVT